MTSYLRKLKVSQFASMKRGELLGMVIRIVFLLSNFILIYYCISGTTFDILDYTSVRRVVFLKCLLFFVIFTIQGTFDVSVLTLTH